MIKTAIVSLRFILHIKYLTTNLISAKEPSTSEIGKEVHNGETEDDILNKFETNCTPDIDPKMEDSILDEIDNLLEKKLHNESKTTSIMSEEELSAEKKNDTSSSDLSTWETEDHNDESTSDKSESDINTKEINSDKENKENENISENINVALEDEEITNKDFEKVDHKTAKVSNKLEDQDTKKNESNQMDIDSESDGKDNNTEFSESNTIAEEHNFETAIEDKTNELVKSNKSILKADKLDSDLKDVESKTSNDDNKLQTDEVMEVDDKENRENNSEEVGVNILNEITPEDDILYKEDSQCTVSKINNFNGDQNIADKVTEKQPVETTNESMEPEDTATADDVNSQSNGPDKCENSNDSSKSQNLECEDLLDISIIRDADEDNASAIAENANDAHTSEKSDNDDQDEGSDKAENELDENEMDQDESLLANDKYDNMDFEDGGSSLCDQENVINGNISDSESKSNAEIRDLEDDSKDSASVSKQNSDNELNSEKNRIDEENFELKDSSNTDTEENEGK